MFFKKKKLDSLLSEAYRNTRINLQYLLEKEDAKTVLITSAEKGDGKTTVVKNLALSFAAIDKSVLIIDCDFRTGRLSEMFNCSNKMGLSDILLEKKEITSAIYKHENKISILPVGMFMNDPDKIISNNMLNEVLNILKKDYDLIIIDTPSIEQFADAQVLSQVVDATVLVVKSGVSTAESVLEGKRLLEGVGAKIVGTILVNKELTSKQRKLGIIN